MQCWQFRDAIFGIYGYNGGDLTVQWLGFGGAVVTIRGAAVVLWVLAAACESGDCASPHHLHQDAEVPVSPKIPCSLLQSSAEPSCSIIQGFSGTVRCQDTLLLPCLNSGWILGWDNELEEKRWGKLRILCARV